MKNIVRFVLALSIICGGRTASCQLPTSIDIYMQHEAGPGILHVFMRANDQSFDQVFSGLVFTVRWPAASAATLSFGNSAWCPAPNQAFQPGPSAMIVPGNGFKYRTWTGTGLAQLGALIDDSGCEQTLLADTWINVFDIPVNNDPGGTFFELSEDTYTIDENRGYFVSLNGEQVNGNGGSLTGTIFTQVTGLDQGTTAMSASGSMVMPNPAHDMVSVALPGEGSGMIMLDLVDPSGRIVLQKNVQVTGNGQRTSMDLSNQPKGVYILRITSGTNLLQERIVLQ